MHLPAPLSRHPVRWIAIAIGVVVVALLIALAVHIHALLQPQRFTSLLENDLAAVGLRLRMQAPAEPTLFPHPGVRLQDFSLTNIGSNTPVLQASGANIVVPWRTLLHGEAAIERVEVNAPRVDLGELKALLGRLPSHAGPPRLPTIETGVQMSHGTLTRDGSPLLFDFSLTTGSLAPGEAFQLDTSARTASGNQIFAVLSTVPSAAHDGVIAFNALHVNIAEEQGTTLQLNGQGSWRGGEELALHLQGTLRHRSLSPPTPVTTSSAPASATPQSSAAPTPNLLGVTDKIALDVAPARGQTPMTVALKLDGNDAHANLHLQPTEFGRWWTRLLATKPGEPSGPLPFTGTAQVQQLDLGWLKASGLSIDAGPDLAPAPATTSAPTPAPAPASTVQSAH